MTATRTPNSSVLPMDSSLFFVLDGTISSRGKAGTVVPAHLRDPIVLDGVTVAPARTPVQIEVTQTLGARMGNMDGSVDIFFESLPLTSGAMLPLGTPTAHIDPHMSAGQYNVHAVTDTVGDIFIPGHFIYHMVRKGSEVTLRPGTVLRARTAATVSVAHGAIAVVTPAPFTTVADTPHPGFVPEPLITPAGFTLPTPKPSPKPS